MPKIIGLSGYARSGKDTVADFLSERRGYNKLSFADEIRSLVYFQNPLIDYQGHFNTLQETIDAFGWEELKGTYEDGAPLSKTIRPLLQNTGMVFRQRFGEDFWIRALLPKIHGKAVIADVRFANEVDAIRAAGGVIWRIEREGLIPSQHISEVGLDSHEFDLVIRNDSNLTALYAAVETALGAD